MAWERLVAARAQTAPTYAAIEVSEHREPVFAVSRGMGWVLSCAILVLVALLSAYLARHVLHAEVVVASSQPVGAPPPARVELPASAVASLAAGDEAVEVEPEIVVRHKERVERRSADEAVARERTAAAKRDERAAKSKRDERAARSKRDERAAKAKRDERAVKVKPGFLTIDSVPYATIYVDGVSVGDTPLIRVSLTPGPHRVRAVTADGSAKNLRVRIVSGETIRHKLRF